tara:strand:+ start:1360 stop:1920 length:561 start_codon:yes stop_codon:yes gene_type:complete
MGHPAHKTKSKKTQRFIERTKCKCKYPNIIKENNWTRCSNCHNNVNQPYFHETGCQRHFSKKNKKKQMDYHFGLSPKYKGGYNPHKKINYYESKIIIYDTCCICYEETDICEIPKSKKNMKINVSNENAVHCMNGVIHCICRECQIKISKHTNNSCPMCRSHTIKQPIYQTYKKDYISKNVYVLSN